MDITYCLIMATYLLVMANSEQTGAGTRKFIQFLYGALVAIAIFHIIT